jgi:hypothetical protein
MFVFPFSETNNYDLKKELFGEYDVTVNAEIRNLLLKTLSESDVNDLQYGYYTPDQIKTLHARNKKNLNLSIFHINIRSLNCNHDKLVSVLEACSIKFHILILSEIWSSNIHYYSNLLGSKYNFFYDLPLASKTGGVGIYAKCDLNPKLRNDLKSCINSSNFENIWLETEIDKTKYYVAGYYRHPNTSIKDFRDNLTLSLDKVKNKKRVIWGGVT